MISLTFHLKQATMHCFQHIFNQRFLNKCLKSSFIHLKNLSRYILLKLPYMYLDIFFTGLPFWPFQVMLYQAGPYIGPFCSFWALFCRIFYFGSFVVSIGLFGRFWPFWPKRQNWPKMSQKLVKNWLKGPTSWSTQYIPENYVRNFFGTPCSQGK